MLEWVDLPLEVEEELLELFDSESLMDDSGLEWLVVEWLG